MRNSVKSRGSNINDDTVNRFAKVLSEENKDFVGAKISVSEERALGWSRLDRSLLYHAERSGIAPAVSPEFMASRELAETD